MATALTVRVQEQTAMHSLSATIAVMRRMAAHREETVAPQEGAPEPAGTPP
jgi:hypothetical protein